MAFNALKDLKDYIEEECRLPVYLFNGWTLLTDQGEFSMYQNEYYRNNVLILRDDLMKLLGPNEKERSKSVSKTT